MAGTPPASLIFPSPARHEPPSALRTPGAWAPAQSTPATAPGSRYLQPLATPRTDGGSARWAAAAELPSLPSASLLDADVGAPFAAAQPAEDTAPWSLAVAGAGAMSLGGPYRESAVQAAQQAQVTDTWVTVFGFPPEELHNVMREFQKCGEVVDSGTFAPELPSAQPANWVHIRFSHTDEARRALLRNGFQLTSNLIIGVKEFDWRQRAAISELARDTLPVRPAVRLTAPALERPYLIARAPGGGGMGALSGVEPRTSLLGKFSLYVLGI